MHLRSLNRNLLIIQIDLNRISLFQFPFNISYSLDFSLSKSLKNRFRKSSFLARIINVGIRQKQMLIKHTIQVAQIISTRIFVSVTIDRFMILAYIQTEFYPSSLMDLDVLSHLFKRYRVKNTGSAQINHITSINMNNTAQPSIRTLSFWNNTSSEKDMNNFLSGSLRLLYLQNVKINIRFSGMISTPISYNNRQPLKIHLSYY